MLFNHRKETEQGFTLTELLVVILIIGILAAIAIPLFLNQRKAAKEASLKSDLKSIATQVEGSYDTKNQEYKTVLTAGTVGGETGDDTEVSTSPVIEVFTSPGNMVTSISNADEFCLTGVNSEYSDMSWYFSSAKGGLTQDIGDCAGALPETSTPETEVPVEEDGSVAYIGQCHPLVEAYVRSVVDAYVARTPGYEAALNRAQSYGASVASDPDYMAGKLAWEGPMNTEYELWYGENSTEEATSNLVERRNIYYDSGVDVNAAWTPYSVAMDANIDSTGYPADMATATAAYDNMVQTYKVGYYEAWCDTPYV